MIGLYQDLCYCLWRKNKTGIILKHKVFFFFIENCAYLEAKRKRHKMSFIFICL